MDGYFVSLLRVDQYSVVTQRQIQAYTGNETQTHMTDQHKLLPHIHKHTQEGGAAHTHTLPGTDTMSNKAF